MERIKENYKDELERFENQRSKIRRLWNISEPVGKFLYRLIEISRPKRILELGTSNGYSTFWLSVSSKNFGGKVFSIEVDESRYAMAKENLKNIKNVVLINDLIENTIVKLKEKFDMIFIDANKSDYISYIKLLIENDKLNKPCLIIADNVISHKESVKEYLNFITTDSRFFTEIEKIGTGIALSVFEG